MRASDYLKSRFYNADDFGERPVTFIIASINEETVGRENPTAKPVLELADGDGAVASRLLALNKTNLRTLAKAYGDDMKTWVGRPVRICSVPVNYGGKPVRGIRVAAAAVAVREPARAAGGGEAPSLNDEVPF